MIGMRQIIARHEKMGYDKNMNYRNCEGTEQLQKRNSDEL